MVYRQLGDFSLRRGPVREVPVGGSDSWGKCQLREVPVGESGSWEKCRLGYLNLSDFLNTTNGHYF